MKRGIESTVSSKSLEIDEFPDVFAPPANGIGFTAQTWLPKFVIALILFILIDGTFAGYHSLRESECLNGDRHACRIAKDYWGWTPTTKKLDDPKCPDGCVCIGPHHTPICGY